MKSYEIMGQDYNLEDDIAEYIEKLIDDNFKMRYENAKLKTENATLNDTICGIARSVYE